MPATKKKLTYISLFSSAGVGCYGFSIEGFDCIATNELIKRRLDIQHANNKCKYETGYICGDITEGALCDALYREINMWKKEEHIDTPDVVIATPPCQGMSVANLKKNNEMGRNSLVVHSIDIIQHADPKIFLFENVAAFLKTTCRDLDGKVRTIDEAIKNDLGDRYVIMSKVINFKDYGSNSSRTRTLVIGVRRDYEDYISPIDLFPKRRKAKTLRQIIGKMRPLNTIGEVSDDDIYHSFRTYPVYMRDWIHDLKEGESAFDNKDDFKKPHTIVDGKIKINAQKTGDKYKRQFWDKIAPCVHTRNDQLASQNTIHPSDDRVFSVRELMKIMTIPDSFKWTEIDEKMLNEMCLDDKKKFLKKEEINIRQSLGEAVPTEIFRQIAHNIKTELSKKRLNLREIRRIIDENKLNDNGNLTTFIDLSRKELSFVALSQIAEFSNAERNNDEAFYTSKSLLNHIYKNLPAINKKVVRVLEPSVGVGNFLPYIISKYSDADRLIIDVVDINKNSIETLKHLIKTIDMPENVTLNYVVDDFLTHNFSESYDLVIGNPPFAKLKNSNKILQVYRKKSINKKSYNTSSYFLEKATTLSKNVVMVMPKFLLNTEEYGDTRNYLSTMRIESITDFGEKGFPGVLIETICIQLNTKGKPDNTKITSVAYGTDRIVKQKYFADKGLPYWIIYRDNEFDKIASKMQFGIFDVFRDRQITNGNTEKIGDDHAIWVIKSRNISDDGRSILHIDGYDSYINKDNLNALKVKMFLRNNDVYMTPNMTYKPRVCKKPINTVVNGSVALLLPKNGVKLSQRDMDYFSSDEYRRFYRIARNYQTRSLNIDNTSVYFFGIIKEKK